MSAFEMVQIPVLQDNYVYVVRDPRTGDVAVIDPSVAEPVIDVLEARGWTPSLIINTHHHFDHVGGNEVLKKRYNCHILGPEADRHRIPALDQGVRQGDIISVGQAQGQVFETPGHTSGHISLFFPEQKALFCGDTLFSLGCGRLFEGTAEQMWASLSQLAALPEDTLVCCAHEYTQANAAFALSVDPDNADLQARAQEVDALRQADKSTVPSTLGFEKRANPFLRADDTRLAEILAMTDTTAAERLAKLRRLKEQFQS